MKCVNKYFSLCAVLMVLLSPVQAAKIYKWVDSQGNVHFSNTPGPEQDASAHIGETTSKISRSSQTTQSLESILQGTWYGSLRGQSFQLSFNGSRMSWYETDERPNVVNKRTLIFEAIWKEQNGDLNIAYLKPVFSPEKAGSSDIIQIISKSEESLTLQFPDKRVFNMRKSTSSRQIGLEGSNIIGSWLRQHDNADVKFTSGRYVVKNHVKNSTGKVVVEQGNWYVENNVMKFTYTKGYHTAGRQGTTASFNILLSEKEQLILEEPGTENQVIYNKKLSK